MAVGVVHTWYSALGDLFGTCFSFSLMSTRLVIVAFWAFILVGLPFWWKTTEVYRANLPLNEIKAWQEDQVSFSLHVQTPRIYKQVHIDTSP